jgi:hypothetical protein
VRLSVAAGNQLREPRRPEKRCGRRQPSWTACPSGRLCGCRIHRTMRFSALTAPEPTTTCDSGKGSNVDASVHETCGEDDAAVRTSQSSDGDPVYRVVQEASARGMPLAYDAAL